MPLYKVELLSQRFLDDKWIGLSQHCRTESKLRIKIDLLIMGALAVLGGTVHSFRQLPTVTNICATEHSKFFQKFVKYLFDKREDYIYLPRDDLELRAVMQRYEEMGLPGAMGSVDVVHVKWSNCPAGDFNRAKGKQSYPSLAFECITYFDRRICHVHGPQLLEGPTEILASNGSNRLTILKLQFHRRQNLLAHHLWVWKSKCKNWEIEPNLNP